LIVISQTQQNVIMRLARFPDGPTLHFRINAYSLSRSVRATQRRPYDSPAACTILAYCLRSRSCISLALVVARNVSFRPPNVRLPYLTFPVMTPPLVVLNNFSQSVESHTKLMRVTFQHMFPTINIKTVKLSECRRVVLFHLMDDGNVEMRHYAVRANPVGVSKSVKRIIEAKLPDLGSLEVCCVPAIFISMFLRPLYGLSCGISSPLFSFLFTHLNISSLPSLLFVPSQDISEYIEGTAGMSGFASDSEAEDEGSRVTLPDRFIGKGNAKSQQSAMKLTELGPRLTLEIFKVEQGVNEGDVLYHKFVHKTPAEAAKIKAKIEKSKRLKEDRKATQEANVKRKREAEAEKRQAKIDRKRAKIEGASGAREGGGDSDSDDEEPESDDENKYAEYDGIENDDDYDGEEDADSDEE